MEETAFSIYVQTYIKRRTSFTLAQKERNETLAGEMPFIQGTYIYIGDVAAPGVLETDLFLSNQKVVFISRVLYSSAVIFLGSLILFSPLFSCFYKTCCWARGFFFARCGNNDGGKR